MHVCALCDKPAQRRCSGCTTPTAWYCSTECQKKLRVSHIFECNPKRAITTADHLVLAIVNNRCPDDAETCADYGFDRAFTAENRANLLGLYVGLIVRIGTPAKSINKWKVQGRLVEEIQDAYSRLPADARGDFYRWFVQNTWVLDRTQGIPGNPAEDMIYRANVYSGIGHCGSIADIRSEIGHWPENKYDCYELCGKLLSHWHPGPIEKIWVTFGFCACTSEWEEDLLGEIFGHLNKKCTFEELYTAYDSSSLFQLLKKHGFGQESLIVPNFTHVLLRSPRSIESVWWLKRFAVAEDHPEFGVQLERSVATDYGFNNCRSQDLMAQLKDVYRRLFLEPLAVDPLELHRACLQGQLFEFVCRYIKFNKAEKKCLSKLMRNRYSSA